MDITVALVHYPVLNRHGDTVTTAVTNLDIHDLARAAATYGVRGATLVTPIAQQRSLIERIVEHWVDGEGRKLNPFRARAFERVDVAPSVEALVARLTAETGAPPLTVATGAGLDARLTTYSKLRDRLLGEQGTALLLFGTGWGMSSALIAGCDLYLPAIRAVPERDTYNHLSVRCAAAIVLDRLLGAREV
jgi:hypothetical protein